MSDLILKRIRSDDDGTFGELYMDETQIAVTCEPPWRNNEHNISCIPTGAYHYIPHDTEKHPDTWELSVPNRTAILIHTGNSAKDTEGCILVGDHFTMIDGKPAIADSRITLASLRGMIPQFGTIEIVNETAS